MANRIFPNWEQLKSMHNKLTPGEEALLLYLDKYLPKDDKWTEKDKLENYNGWLIFAQPFLNGSRPDIVIFNPNVGAVIYEVKDWNLKNYEWKLGKTGSKSLFVNDSKGSYPVKEPQNQVLHYKNKIIGELVSIIGEQVDKNQKNFGLVKIALYFHNENTQTVKSFFQDKIKNFNYCPVFGYDSLEEIQLGYIVPNVKFTKSKYWDRNWNNDIIFWLKPPFHSIEQGTLLKLKYNQIKIAEPRPGHHRVRGIAGSGKTQALAYRAGKLAEMGLNVLILTFNITLWHYIRDMIARAPFKFYWDKITFNHFHGFCKDILNEYGEKWPEENNQDKEEFFKTIVPEAVKKAIEGKKIQKYNAVLIDEGQDYQFEWYDLLSSHFLSERDELLIVCDKRQNIYDRKLDWLDKRVTRKGLEKFVKPYIDLEIIFRMPSRVADMANDFSKTFNLYQELKEKKSNDNNAFFHSQHIVWVNIDKKDWLKYTHSAYKRLNKEGKHPSDIIILLPNHKQGKECVYSYEKENIYVNHVFEDIDEEKFHPHKKAFWMGDSRLKMSTIHSFKGWELLNIVLLIPPKAPDTNENLDAVVYTAITRTRENLIILNTNDRYAEFGKNYPSKWKEQIFK